MDDFGIVEGTNYSHVIFTSSGSLRKKRALVKNEKILWPRGEIPYTLDTNGFCKYDLVQTSMTSIQRRYAHGCIVLVFTATKEERDFNNTLR